MSEWMEIFNKKEEIFEAYKLISEYEFYVDVAEGDHPLIKVRILLGLDNRYHYHASHAIWTPDQMGPYHSSLAFGKTEKEAIAKAVEDIMSYYNDAVRNGHTPSEKWFHPNASFKE